MSKIDIQATITIECTDEITPEKLAEIIYELDVYIKDFAQVDYTTSNLELSA